MAGDGNQHLPGSLGARRTLQNLRDVARPHTQASEISCPARGLYFGSEAGLVMHIKNQHKETHENAKATYVKSKHSMCGIPMRKFCLKVQSDWQSLEKHITMGGGVLRLKQPWPKASRWISYMRTRKRRTRRTPPNLLTRFSSRRSRRSFLETTRPLIRHRTRSWINTRTASNILAHDVLYAVRSFLVELESNHTGERRIQLHGHRFLGTP